MGALSFVIHELNDDDVADINALGFTDWTVWDESGTQQRKSGGGSTISSLSSIGSPDVGNYDGDPGLIAWNGGTPESSGDSAGGGIFYSGLDEGYSFTFPATTASRRAAHWLGGFQNITRIRASLSDSSATAIEHVFDSIGTDSARFYVEIDYQANGTATLLIQVDTTQDNGFANVAARAAGWLTNSSGVVVDLTAATLSWSAKALQNKLNAINNLKTGTSWSPKALQNRLNAINNLKTGTSWSPKALQNRLTSALSAPVFAWSAKALQFVAGAFVFDLTKATFSFSAKALQNVQQATHNLKVGTSWSAKTLQNKLTNTLSLPQIRLTAQALSARLTVALNLKTGTSWSAKVLQTTQRVSLTAAQFLFQQRAITYVTDAVAQTVKRAMSRYSHYRKLLKTRRY